MSGGSWRDQRDQRGKGRGRPTAPEASPPREGPAPLKVNGHSDRWLAQGFPWIYPNEVDGRRPRPGVVEVVGPQGTPRGVAIADDGWIAARVFRPEGGPLDAAWAADLLARAVARRRGVLPADTTAWRLIHAENDGLPGIRVDAWGRHRVVTLDTPSVAPVVMAMLPALTAAEVDAVWLCYRPDPRETLDLARMTDPAPGLLWGDDQRGDGEVIVHEAGMALAVRPWDGPDAGAYPDMRDVRRWLAPTWSGATVLNTFAYTGAFSVHALRHGAASALSVDLSRGNLDRARRNVELNGLDPARHAVEAEDTFKVLDRLRRQGVRFDRVILDPPSFSHGPHGTWSAAKDYPRLVAAAAHVTAPGGWIIAATNHGQTAPREHRGHVAQGLARAGRVGAELAFFGAAPDFPARTTFPEGHYLKVGVWTLD